ncbi:MAG: DUF6786 family protein, partial [Acidobacteriota bacterium]|nr:DUF6786 family protein [Acidobacteriota bacterium]
ATCRSPPRARAARAGPGRRRAPGRRAGGAAALGPFYELETSSPAATLTPGQSLTHKHQTYHFEGTKVSLDPIVQEAFGVSLDTIVTAFP